VRLLHLQRRQLHQQVTHWACLLLRLLLRHLLGTLALHQLPPCLPRLVLRCLLLHLRLAGVGCRGVQQPHLLPLHQLHLPLRQVAA
jgi:hypothetical protein